MYRINNDLPGETVKLDVKDKKILEILSKNSRITISQLAREIRLSRDTVDYKIKRMQDLNVILQFYPVINFRKMKYMVFHVFINIDESDKKRQGEFMEVLKNHPNIYRVMEYSDQWDYEFVLISKTMEEFNQSIAQITYEFSDIILEKSKLVKMETYFSTLLPYKFHTKYKVEKAHINDIILDNKDIKILHHLSKNCRQSTYEISKKIQMSPDAIGLRIKKMYNSGIIEKFTILVNFTNLDFNWYTLVVRVKFFDRDSELKFREFIKYHEYIVRAVKTLGMWDLLIYVIADNSRIFHKTVKHIKTEFANIIRNYGTFAAYKEHVFNAMPKVIG
ncbi:MAG: AsnC family transcriptional regulator [Nanoarchaeota archaeon]